MTIDRYLTLYEEYKKDTAAIERVAKLQREASEGVTYTWMWYGGKNNYVDKESLERELARRVRIMKRASARIQAAISRIRNDKFSNYLICRYLYGMKNSDIALALSYCDRHIYRLSRDAKQRLKTELVKLLAMELFDSPEPEKYILA